MNSNALKSPKHRAAIELSAPIGKAFAAACKTQGFRSLPRQIMTTEKDTNCKTGPQKPNPLFQTGLNGPKIGSSINEMPIDQSTS